MKVFCVCNNKGGCGKTTTVIELASMWRRAGMKVLLIDADAQGNTTDTFRAVVPEGTATLYDAILARDNEISPMDECIQQTDFGDIVPSDELLADADVIISSKGVSGYFYLKESLDNMKKKYDIVIIDTNPALNKLLDECLLASTNIIIPIGAERYDMIGISKLSQTLYKMKRQKPDLNLSGLVLTKFDSRTKQGRLARNTLINISKQMNIPLYKSVISDCSKVRESQSARMPVSVYDPSCKASYDYAMLAEEIYPVIIPYLRKKGFSKEDAYDIYTSYARFRRDKKYLQEKVAEVLHLGDDIEDKSGLLKASMRYPNMDTAVRAHKRMIERQRGE